MKRRVIAFTWLDAVTSHGWQEAKGLKADVCVAAGVLIEETDAEVTVAVTVSKDANGDDQMNASMTIPKGWIKGELVTLGWIEDNRFSRRKR